MNVPLLGLGQVRHERLRPATHAFRAPALFLMLPMRGWRRNPAASPLARNRRAALAFRDADHGDGRGDALAWLDALLDTAGIRDADGEVWLHCFPRVFGFTFKPVSFWYCHRADESLRAIVVEVNNTFGERHVYLLDAPAWGRELHADKVFHVSPFCPVEGAYRFRFLLNASRDRTVARIDYDDAQGPLLRTSVSGTLQPATRTAIAAALWRHAGQGVGVLARIHWHALLLWLKGVTFFGKPALPEHPVTRSAR